MKKYYKLIYIFFIIILFIIAFVVYNNVELWFDELCTVQTIGRDKSLGDTIRLFYTYDTYNLPLYFIIAYIFYHGMFFSKISLFLPGIICSIIGLIFLLKIIRNLFDKKTSIIITSFIVFSSTFISNILLEVRCYGLLFMLCVLFLYFYLKRFNNDNKKNIIILGLIGSGLMYTHWFGSLLIIFYFISDCYLCLRKKSRKKVLISYMIMFGLFLPWIFMIIKYNAVNLFAFWPAIPKLSDVLLLINYMIGVDNSRILSIIVFFISCILIIIRRNKDKKNNFNIFLHCIFLMVSIIFCVYVYSAYINRNCSLFVERYFIVLLPQIYIILSYFIYFIFSKKFKKNKIGLLLPILSCLILNFLIINNTRSSFVYFGDSYKNMAEYLYENEDIYDDTTLLVAGEYLWYLGFFEFYFENKNLEIPKNYVIYFGDFEIDDYDIVYLMDFLNRQQAESVLNDKFVLVDSSVDRNVFKYKKVK